MAYVVARRLLSEGGETLQNTEGPLAIRGTEGLVLSYAKCCSPIPGDPIVCHLSAGKGMVVHLETCRNIGEIRHNTRIVDQQADRQKCPPGWFCRCRLRP
jgi:guanosine-3',5'-bis(diphosphate) 3'-pyrophosphohydrolase